ncbi:Fucose-specific lectin-like protein [Cladobotryum mycophilum]|uniref:Fucose-specific lectin-like protein n=1 Tax=Cladobotryum mycophilum TaxID=491253 RepID=A0ABR0SYI2_9HYPO
MLMIADTWGLLRCLQRVYFQGVDGGIYEVAYSDEKQSWRGGQKSSQVALAKSRSPIAATAWQQSSGNGQPEVWDAITKPPWYLEADMATSTQVRVYFLNEDNFLRERIWTPASGWSDGTLNDLKVEATPPSQLAVTSWGEGNTMFCYQGVDGDVRVLNGWADQDFWMASARFSDADFGSALSICSLESGGCRSVRLYFQEEGSFREAAWSGVRDDSRETPEGHYISQHMMEIPEKTPTSISAVAWESDARGMRVYLGARDYLSELGYVTGWIPLAMDPEAAERDGAIAAVQRSPGRLCIYSVESVGLVELALHDGVWTRNGIMSGSRCRGTVCPSHPQTSVPQTLPSQISRFLHRSQQNNPLAFPLSHSEDRRILLDHHFRRRLFHIAWRLSHMPLHIFCIPHCGILGQGLQMLEPERQRILLIKRLWDAILVGHSVA